MGGGKLSSYERPVQQALFYHNALCRRFCLWGVFFVLFCFVCVFSTVGVVVLLVLLGSCCFLVFWVVCFVSLACVCM